nr:RNA-directed DNA polymerase, eukaryota, reverse transcriptase zinc-binding domain protein [Tanacetum cinerariifolium]
MSIQSHLKDLDKIIDQGKCNEEVISERSKLLKDLFDLNSSTTLDLAQKAKIRWAIEGDENFKYFHERCGSVVLINLLDPMILVLNSSKNIGTSLTKMVAAVLLFFSTCSFPPECNSSFIVLIPKMEDAKMVKDFRPISLIGSMYKIIAKILANRLSLVISDFVINVQSAFVSNRQILNGPFIFNELISWCKRKNAKAMIFKVDFKKALDSVRWDFLDEVLNKFRCTTLSSPFNYLGVKVGGFMSRLSSWEDIIAKISSRLSKWKLKTLGGRFTLMKSVLSYLALHYFSIFKVPKGILNKMEAYRRNFFNGMDKSDRKLSLIGQKKILASEKNEELGVSSLFALNRALLFKWIWRRPPRGGIKEDQLRLLEDIISSIVLFHSSDRWI